jgi:peptidyl-prolyl cis-trans isomerase B (cyclophilin B)
MIKSALLFISVMVNIGHICLISCFYIRRNFLMKKASISFENGEQILIELFPEHAPGTVANFEKLIREGFYNGLTFHRVIPGFVSQGGDPNGNGTGGPGYKIKCETVGNPLKHKAGALSMAHAGKDTGGSQFFIVHEPQPHLDGVHTVFGQVIEGMDTVLRMRNGDVMKEVKVWDEE